MAKNPYLENISAFEFECFPISLYSAFRLKEIYVGIYTKDGHSHSALLIQNDTHIGKEMVIIMSGHLAVTCNIIRN